MQQSALARMLQALMSPRLVVQESSRCVQPNAAAECGGLDALAGLQSEWLHFQARSKLAPFSRMLCVSQCFSAAIWCNLAVCHRLEVSGCNRAMWMLCCAHPNRLELLNCYLQPHLFTYAFGSCRVLCCKVHCKCRLFTPKRQFIGCSVGQRLGWTCLCFCKV